MPTSARRADRAAQPAVTTATDVGPQDVIDTLWMALAVVRFVLLGLAVALTAARWDEFDHPLAGWLVTSGIAAWTLVVTWAYDTPRGRWWPVLAADVAVAVGALLLTPYVQSADMLERHASTVPSYWVATPVLAWAVYQGWIGGVTSAVVVSVADLAVRDEVTGTTLGNLFLLLMSGAVVGYLSSLVRRTVAERDRAAELAARTAERERLARAVHDGVLQVLTYVQRRGTEIGGDAVELATAAGEQEEILRALVRAQPTPDGEVRADRRRGRGRDTDRGGESDVGRRLGRLAAPGRSVAVPAGPVTLDDHKAEELLAAIRAALDNVEQHAPGSRTYLLLEDEGDAVVVSVRDDGPGIPAGRLAEAEAAGRMGVSRSIVGRIEQVGGAATLTTVPGRGTEWEFRVPR